MPVGGGGGPKADFCRFSRAHSWYKHIPFEGRVFYAYQMLEATELIWYFSSFEPSPPLASYPFRVGPFLRGIEGYGHLCEAFFNGLHIIIQKAGIEVFKDWIFQHYPHFSHLPWESYSVEWTHPYAVEEIYTTEWKKYYQGFKEAISKYACVDEF